MQTDASLNKSYFVLLGALCFSTSGTLQAIAPDGATPYVLSAIRMLVGGILLFIWCLLRKKLIWGGSWPWFNVVMSVFALVVFQISFFNGVLEVGVAVGTMISIGLSPILVAAMGFIILKEVPQKSWYLSTLVAIIGLVLLNFNTTQKPSLSGIIFPILAGLSYSSYFIFSKALVKNNPPELVTVILALASALCLSPAYFIFPVEWIFTFSGLSVSFFLGFITIALAFPLLLAGQKHTSVSTSATITLADPLAAACFGVIFLGERVGFYSVIGMICILSSVLILIYLPQIGIRKKV